MEFKDLGLPNDLLKAVDKLGFDNPSEIQEKAIPILSNGKQDLVGLAQTGTGKTAAYGLPVIQNVSVPYCHVQGLILSPTRELCIQINNDLKSFSRYSEGLKIVPVYGGTPINRYIRVNQLRAYAAVCDP